jgi:hypothetical protein
MISLKYFEAYTWSGLLENIIRMRIEINSNILVYTSFVAFAVSFQFKFTTEQKQIRYK